MNSPKKVYLPVCKLRTEFNSPVTKSTSPRLGHHFLCTLDSYCWNQIKLQSCEPVWFVSSLYLFLPHYYNHSHDLICLTQMMQNCSLISILLLILRPIHVVLPTAWPGAATTVAGCWVVTYQLKQKPNLLFSINAFICKTWPTWLGRHMSKWSASLSTLQSGVPGLNSLLTSCWLCFSVVPGSTPLTYL